MTFITGNVIGKEFCEALNIASDNVSEILINIKAGDVAHVVIKRFITGDESTLLREILEKYELHTKRGDDE